MRLLRVSPALSGLVLIAVSVVGQDVRAQSPRSVAAYGFQQDVVVPPTPTRRPDRPELSSASTTTGVSPRSGIVLAEGTPLPVRPTRRLSSRLNFSGDRFEAVLDEDLLDSGGRVILPRGTIVTGYLSNVRPGGRVSGRAEMTLALDSVEIGSQRHPIETEPILVKAQGSKARDARKIGIAAAIGAAIGAIAGGKKGAAVGATIGGGAGTARVITTRGRAAEIEKEQLLTFSLSRRFDTREAVSRTP